MFALWSALFVGYCGACATPGNLAGRDSTNPKSYVDLTEYLLWIPDTVRSYARTDTNKPTESPTLYRQRTTNLTRAEGTLIEMKPLPISMYLDRDSNRPDRPRLKWKMPVSHNSGGFFVEFLPPFVEWPQQLALETPSVQRGTIHLYDRDGHFLSTGPATRSVWLEGYESIDCAGSIYPRCVVLRSQTELGLGWWAHVNLNETVWLAKDIGAVRRLQRIEGDMLILFQFRSEHRFDLREVSPAPRWDRTTLKEPKRWARLVIYLDRLLPNPRASGLIVEWAVPHRE